MTSALGQSLTLPEYPLLSTLPLLWASVPAGDAFDRGHSFSQKHIVLMSKDAITKCHKPGRYCLTGPEAGSTRRSCHRAVAPPEPLRGAPPFPIPASGDPGCPSEWRPPSRLCLRLHTALSSLCVSASKCPSHKDTSHWIRARPHPS